MLRGRPTRAGARRPRLGASGPCVTAAGQTAETPVAPTVNTKARAPRHRSTSPRPLARPTSLASAASCVDFHPLPVLFHELSRLLCLGNYGRRPVLKGPEVRRMLPDAVPLPLLQPAGQVLLAAFQLFLLPLELAHPHTCPHARTRTTMIHARVNGWTLSEPTARGEEEQDPPSGHSCCRTWCMQQCHGGLCWSACRPRAHCTAHPTRTQQNRTDLRHLACFSQLRRVLRLLPLSPLVGLAERLRDTCTWRPVAPRTRRWG